MKSPGSWNGSKYQGKLVRTTAYGFHDSRRVFRRLASVLVFRYGRGKIMRRHVNKIHINELVLTEMKKMELTSLGTRGKTF